MYLKSRWQIEYSFKYCKMTARKLPFVKKVFYSFLIMCSFSFLFLSYTIAFCLLVYSLDDSIILGSLDRNRYLGKLMSYLDPVLQSSDRSVFLRCWHANTDGWASTTFHSNCDGKGPTVTIIRVNDHIFGGYTNVSWNSSKH